MKPLILLPQLPIDERMRLRFYRLKVGSLPGATLEQLILNHDDSFLSASR